MAEKLGFYFDQTLCTGCKACSVACKDKHDHAVGITWRRFAEYAGGTSQQVGDTFVPNVFSFYTSITRPRLVITPHRDAQPTGSGTGFVANPGLLFAGLGFVFAAAQWFKWGSPGSVRPSRGSRPWSV